MNRKISIIGVPFALGSHRRGCDLGPDAIRHAGLHQKLNENHIEFEDKGNCKVYQIADESNSKLKNLQSVYDTCISLATIVDEEMKKGHFPLVLGGDHSIAMGTIAGVRGHVQNLGVIWIDAHGDVNTEETTPSGNIHGMPLATSMGFGNSKLIHFFKNEKNIKPENVVIIGVRDLDEGEVKFLNEQRITYYNMNRIENIGITNVGKEIHKKFIVNQVDGVHISFDLDSLDPSVVKGVGTPVVGGLTFREGVYLLEEFKKKLKIVSAEFVEVNPLLDDQNKTAEITVELITHLLK